MFNSSYKTSTLEYQHNNKVFEAFVAKPDNVEFAPGVIICHAWAGRDKFVEEVACKLASLGYVGVAIDVYGKGIIGTNKNENMLLMQPLLDDRLELQGRLHAGLLAAERLEFITKNKMAAIGYCFGGMCALDLARMGTNLNGAISVHGFFNPPNNLKNYIITTKILALHGYLDPMVSADQIKQFMLELTNAKADWQFINYGNAMHAFTNPAVNDPDFGTVYNQLADKRSWHHISQFLSECLT